MRTRRGFLLFSVLRLAAGCSQGPAERADTDASSSETTDGVETSASENTAETTLAETETGVPAEPVNLDIDAYPFDTLSEYNFFQGHLGDLMPNTGVVGYTVAAPLWADAAEKGRFFVIPEGTAIAFTTQDAWEFPTGSVFIKNFYFDQDRGNAEDLRVVETRLLVLEADDQWQGYVYLWNGEQTEAERTKGGADVYIDFVDEAGAPHSQLYLVPDQNVCETCHRHEDRKVLLGPTTLQMNTAWPIGGDEEVNQIDWLFDNGFFRGDVPASADLPALANPASNAPIDARARAYLHGNCAHCHRPGGLAGITGLRLSIWVDNPGEYGVCNRSGGAGSGADGSHHIIWPGHPEKSVLPIRMASDDPELKMPEQPNLLPDAFGVGLIEQWITELDGAPCE
ncbi:MAG: hypothetical protein ACRBN8_01890 [Nannocystales bacterium]